jgi:uncharacterized protein
MLSKNPNIDVDKVRSATYLYEWDRYVQCPTWGYPTEGAYYRDASSADVAYNVRIPTMALHAKDDPIISDIAVPYELFHVNPYWVMVATDHGGHLGWYEYSGDRWSNKAVVEFFHKFVERTDGLAKPIPELRAAVTRSTDSAGNPATWDPLRRRTARELMQ